MCLCVSTLCMPGALRGQVRGQILWNCRQLGDTVCAGNQTLEPGSPAGGTSILDC